MATSVDETDQQAEHLKCSVCLERFQEPKVLRCQHMYCKTCLERLVTRIGRNQYAITCPECRENTEVSNGDVMSLQSNYVINRLLSNVKRSISSPSCTKHKGEILKLFCQSCDELICGDCTIIDHRDHKCSFIKDIFAAEKEKILKLIEESKVKIRALESSIETLKEQEESIDKNCLEVRQKLDSFIDKQIKLLEKKKQSLLDELQESVLSQKNNIREQMGTFVSSLDCLKNNTESIAQNLSKGSEVDVLSTKNQMIQQLTKINSATANLKPRGRISYDLETDPPLNENKVGKMAKIRQYDKEAKIRHNDEEAKIRQYDEEAKISGQRDKEYKFTIVSGHSLFREQEEEALKSTGVSKSKFYLLPKFRRLLFYSPDNEVQVNIISPYLSKVYSSIISKEKGGSFSFSHHPEMSEDYKIEIIINGSPMHGSPFTWGVWPY